MELIISFKKTIKEEGEPTLQNEVKNSARFWMKAYIGKNMLVQFIECHKETN